MPSQDDTLPPMRCEILPAEPYVNIDTGEQTDQLIANPYPELAAISKRHLDSYKGSLTLIPAHEFAPEHHGKLVDAFNAHARSSREGNHSNDFVFINHIANSAPFQQYVTNALEEAHNRKGGEKYEDRKLRFGSKHNWLMEQLPEYKDDPKRYYRLVCDACLASEHKEQFLHLLNKDLSESCHRRSGSMAHRSTEQKIDPVHEQRYRVMRAALSIDPQTGDIRCDAKAYRPVVEDIAREDTQWFEKRLNDLRKKMLLRSQDLHRWSSGEGATARAIRRAAKLENDTPFNPPLSQPQAQEIFEKALRAIPSESPLIRRLLNIALSDERLTIAISNSQNHIESIAGKSLDEKHHTYTMGQSGDEILHLSRTPDIDVTIEELMHHAIRRLYRNNAQPNTRKDSGRRSLFLAAVSEDFKRNGMAQARKDFNLEAYPASSIPAEVPAKALTMMALGTWDDIKDRYPVIDRYINIALEQDVRTYEEKGYVEPYGPSMERVISQAVKTSIASRNFSPKP